MKKMMQELSVVAVADKDMPVIGTVGMFPVGSCPHQALIRRPATPLPLTPFTHHRAP